MDLPAGTLPIRLVNREETLKYEDDYNDMFTKLIRKNISNSIGLPVSIQITGQCWKDELILKAMSDLELIFKFK